MLPITLHNGRVNVVAVPSTTNRRTRRFNARTRVRVRVRVSMGKKGRRTRLLCCELGRTEWMDGQVKHDLISVQRCR